MRCITEILQKIKHLAKHPTSDNKSFAIKAHEKFVSLKYQKSDAGL